MLFGLGAPGPPKNNLANKTTSGSLCVWFSSLREPHPPKHSLTRTYLRKLKFLDLMVQQQTAKKCHQNWSPGLIVGAFYTIFRA